MARTATVRAATIDDVPELVTMCVAAREEAGTGPALCTDDRQRLHDQLTSALGLPGVFLLVADRGSEIDGLLLGRIVGPTLFSDTSAIDLEAVYVRPPSRRRGIGHALLGRLVDLADEEGATEVFSAPLPGARGFHRFLARVGFQAAASYRVVTTSSLHRRLISPATTSSTPGAPQRRPGAVSRLIALRRSARAAVDQSSAQVASTNMQVSLAVADLRPDSSSTAIS